MPNSQIRTAGPGLASDPQHRRPQTSPHWRWALRGRSFAIRGPPGTGKSATIANCVAALVAAGKRVLVVGAEEAAVRVVAAKARAGCPGARVLEPSMLLDNIYNRFKRRESRLQPESSTGKIIWLERTVRIRHCIFVGCVPSLCA